MVKKKAEYKPSELKELAMETINAITTDVTIYTDGSTSKTQQNGGAGLTIWDRSGNVLEEISLPAGAFCSSYTGECVAFLEAIRWARDNEVPERETVLICSDSMSMAQAMEKSHWKDMDPWIKQIKEVLFELLPRVILLWIPSHCDVDGNERADDLAKIGTMMEQKEVIVTHKIVKAKILNRKWSITNTKAQDTFLDKRKPDIDIEKQWPPAVRRTFSQLRSGHSMELRYYRKKINLVDSAICDHCPGKEETIEHVLCDCNSTSKARQDVWPEKVTLSMMVSHPDVCRRILAYKYGVLRLPRKKAAPANGTLSEGNMSEVLDAPVGAPAAQA